jgi:hypothetical protein
LAGIFFGPKILFRKAPLWATLGQNLAHFFTKRLVALHASVLFFHLVKQELGRCVTLIEIDGLNDGVIW